MPQDNFNWERTVVRKSIIFSNHLFQFFTNDPYSYLCKTNLISLVSATWEHLNKQPRVCHTWYYLCNHKFSSGVSLFNSLGLSQQCGHKNLPGGQAWSAGDFSHGVWSVTAAWTEQGAASQEWGARGGGLGPPHHPSHCLSSQRHSSREVRCGPLFFWPKDLPDVDTKKKLICSFYDFTAAWFYYLEWLVFI